MINQNICVICLDHRKKHSMNDLNSNEYEIDLSKISMAQIKKFKSLKESSTSQEEKNVFYCNKDLAMELSPQFEKKIFCPICYIFEFNDNNCSDLNKTCTLNCNHKFCKSCLENYIEYKIDRFRLYEIKCLNLDCEYIIQDYEIQKILDDENFKKYKKIKTKMNFYYKINQKVLPCPHPDCECVIFMENSIEELQKNLSTVWSSNQKNKGVKLFYLCELSHSFCIICQDKAHPNRKCNDVK